MNKVICVLAAVVLTVGCGGKGGDKGKTAETDAQAAAAVVEEVTEQAVETFADTRDGKTYRTVKIGKQVWMAENLNYKTDSSWCYKDNPDNCKKYGRLYAWNAAMKACPAGWHLPDTSEWRELTIFAGGVDETAGTRLRSKSPLDWNGTDNYGFSALPGGNYSPDGYFDDIDWGGYWWTATEDGVFAHRRILTSDYTRVSESTDDTRCGSSVRCLRD
jgi:uncharacterized protein (TIGR02145 family)